MRRVGEVQVEEIDGVRYGLRTPDLYDPARARRVLARQGVRRPSQTEFQVAALAGIEAIAAAADDSDEGVSQKALLERWYALLDPIGEDDIDEPDPMKRGEEWLRRETERRQEIAAIYADVIAIEANLERHCPPYAELLADRTYWDDVSRIEIVRLLLVEIDGAAPARDDEGLVTQDAYRAIPAAHRMPLATAAFRLLAPDESQRKN